jgi:phosphoserine aminotransferase
MARVHNFNAGPAALPLPVLEEAQRDLLELPHEGRSTGMSLLEHSHREAPYEAIHHEAIALTKRLYGLGDEHTVLFMQGGARAQFALVPMNFLKPGTSADYLVTGTWAEGAAEEAALVGSRRIAANTKLPDGRFVRVPKQGELDLDPSALYVHLTSNNTLFGTAWGDYPDTGAVPLVIDATSDVMTRSVPWSRVACLYAGAQKNIGPSGVTLVIVRKDFLEAGRTDIPSIFRYKSFADAQSLYNTPPTFSIYLLRGTLRWIEQQGGVAWLEAVSGRKSGAVYAVCDGDPDFFRAPVEKESRSRTNVVFRLPTPELEKRFLSEANKAGLVGLKGHRSTGGIRASVYAAVSMASVEVLVDFMAAFRKTA